jgi:ABC-type nitrate/sulfonate/bicarbonate transport system permease component
MEDGSVTMLGKRINWHGITACLALALAWEAAACMALLPPRLLPPLSLVLSEFMALTLSGTLPSALGHTLLRMGLGLFLAGAAMLPLGIAAGRSPLLLRTLSPTVESLRALPPVLVILPAMLALGIGDSMKVFAVFFAAAFPIFLNTVDAVRTIPPLFLDTARTFRADTLTLYGGVILPASAPGVFSGMRTALPIAFIVAIIAEMISGTDGIGHLLIRSQRTFDIPAMYAAALATAFTGGVLALALTTVESVCLAWHAGWKRLQN